MLRECFRSGPDRRRRRAGHARREMRERSLDLGDSYTMNVGNRLPDVKRFDVVQPCCVSRFFSLNRVMKHIVAPARLPSSSAHLALAQTCDCTVAQGQKNLVPSCNRVIGEIVTVASADELRAAISRANAAGGNLTILIANGTYRVASSTSYPYLT